jgi:hypothetical protein
VTPRVARPGYDPKTARCSAAASFAMRLALLLALSSLLFSSACGSPARRFPLRDAVWVDRDDRPFFAPCSTNEEGKRECMPEEYISPLIWDAVDNTIFLPVSNFFAIDETGEAVNVNSFDETPDSSWFQNRVSKRPLDRTELLRGACNDPAELDPDDPDGTWLIDMGKQNGATPGFRVRTPGGGKFLLKADIAAVSERASAASVIGSRLYHAAGYFTPCERVVYVRPELLRLQPGLESTDNTGITRPFDQAALDRILSRAAWRNGRVRLAASQWLPYPILGPFKYEGTRDDDPNDVVDHEDRRELRGGRLLAAWLNHFDSREQNTMTTWVASGSDKTSSPGHIRHYYLDFSDSFGSEWDWDGISRRLGHSYYLDFGDVIEDFFTLGLLDRPWFRARRTPGATPFGYFNARDFDPEAWQPGYPNPAFAHMTERDGAWMARILARFGRDDVHALVQLADLSEPLHGRFLEQTLLLRLQRILQRYFARLSPLADVRVVGHELCAVDLSRQAGVYPQRAYRYRASRSDGAERSLPLPVRQSGPQRVCVQLGPGSDRRSAEYFTLEIHNGATAGPLQAHLYDLGARRGYRLVGLTRPEP